MGLKERREREKQELREKIMDAARAIFASEGYDAVSMRRIADQIEYSPAAIYAYFPDKESLFREICRCDFDCLLQNFKALAAVDDPLVRLWLIGEGYVQFGVAHPNHYRMMFMHQKPHIPPEAQDLAKLDDPNQDGYAFTRQAVEQAIAAGLIRPELDDAERLTQTIWAVVHGLTAIEITFQNDPWLDLRPLEARRAEAMEVLFRGMVREPDRVPAIRNGASQATRGIGLEGVPA